MAKELSTSACTPQFQLLMADDAVKKEIYTYQAPWAPYSMAWSQRPGNLFRLALGSFVEEYSNKVEIVELDEATGVFGLICSFNHPYPATRVLFTPDPTSQRDLLATTGDYLRLWSIENGTNKLVRLYNNNRNTEFCAPLTSFDWNMTDANLIATASIDTTVTIWDIEKEKALTQLIAHDKEVMDVKWAPGAMSPSTFAAVGADGSMRLFDRRQLEHSTIIYETPNANPLLRLSWNIQDYNYIAAVPMDAKSVVIIDIRVPTVPAAELKGHAGSVNAVVWAPHSSCHLCSAGEDSQAYIWDVSKMPEDIKQPILAYSAEAEVNNLTWSAANPDWIAINFADKMQLLHV